MIRKVKLIPKPMHSMVNINKNDLTTTYKKDLYEAPSYR